ncbi:MAG: hypothetical protein KF800_11915 [Lysobacter sp.]|nr:hypothetical protein [Lysobacter sp.]
MNFKVASASRALATIAVSVVLTPMAYAKCGCPADWIGAPAAESGLGQEFPAAPDLAADTAWRVYEFQKDGIRYTQVNDQAGNVRAAVGRIGGTFFALPIGSDAPRTAVQGDATPAGVPKVLFRAEDVEVVLYQDGAIQRWQVRSPSTH